MTRATDFKEFPFGSTTEHQQAQIWNALRQQSLG